MYRGRGGGGRPFSLRGVRPAQMKPGRGRSGGFPPGGPQSYMESGWAPTTVMRGGGQRPSRFASQTRGRGGPSARGGGGPRGASSRGWSSTRSRGTTRGRGATRGRGGAKAQTTTPAKTTSSKATRTEKEKDEIAMSRPWVTETLRAEIMKKSELQAISFKTDKKEDFEAYKEQRTKVVAMLRAAKMEYIGMQDEQDVDKIMVEAAKKSKVIVSADKSENGTGTSEDTPAANGDDASATAAV